MLFWHGYTVSMMMCGGGKRRKRQAAFSRALEVLGRQPPDIRLLDYGVVSGFLAEFVKGQMLVHAQL